MKLSLSSGSNSAATKLKLTIWASAKKMAPERDCGVKNKYPCTSFPYPSDIELYLWSLSLNSVATPSKPNRPKFKLKLFSAGTVVHQSGSK